MTIAAAPRETDLLLDLCWGKASDAEGDGSFHPVLLHMLDVGAVALAWSREGLGAARARRLLRPNTLDRLSTEQLAFLVAVHDLGKISPGFQAKVPSLARGLAHALSFPAGAETAHGRAGAGHLARLLEADGVDPDSATRVAGATCAHHGSFPPEAPVHAGTGRWPALRSRAYQRLREALGAGPLPALSRMDPGFLVTFAGFVAVCDWVGSNTEFFPYLAGQPADGAHVKRALDRAVLALDSLHLRSWAPTTGVSFHDLFPSITPTALQTRAFDLAEADEPMLMIIEAPTGVGKTEASLAAADRLVARQRLAGMFYGLPTQATSNQMFGRVGDFLAHRYPRQRVNLHLAHGSAHLNEAQRQLQLRAIYDEFADGAVVADVWFSGRKRTLLAPFAVGTIDQAMLASLHVKHFFVRMFGLSGKVVVIDEVHAYDAFMSTIVDGLLAWCRAVGTSVILLSATLTRGRRGELLAAWGAPPSPDVQYPRIGVATSAGSSWHPLPPGRDRLVGLAHLPAEPEGTAAWLEERLAGGGCGAWVCNTVRAAQRAFQVLLARGWPRKDLTLFHGRFTVDDRQSLERDVLGRFSKGGARPSRHVVVATQVIEQSLDLDFDVMASEVAPVDLVLQRAGRLHRHVRSRPTSCSAPVLGIVGPPAGGDPVFGPSAYVYDEHILLRSWLALRSRGALAVPSSSDALLAEVYDPLPPPEELGAALVARWKHTAEELEETLQRSRLRPVHTMLGDPRHEDGFQPGQTTLVDPEDSPDHAPLLQARTRDIGKSATLVGLHDDGDGVWRLRPGGTPVDARGAPDAAAQRALLGAAITVQHPAWVARLARVAVPASWKKVGSLQNCRPVLFDVAGRAELEGVPLFLHPDLGLVLRAEDLESA